MCYFVVVFDIEMFVVNVVDIIDSVDATDVVIGCCFVVLIFRVWDKCQSLPHFNEYYSLRLHCNMVINYLVIICWFSFLFCAVSLYWTQIHSENLNLYLIFIPLLKYLSIYLFFNHLHSTHSHQNTYCFIQKNYLLISHAESHDIYQYHSFQLFSLCLTYFQHSLPH